MCLCVFVVDAVSRSMPYVISERLDAFELENLFRSRLVISIPLRFKGSIVDLIYTEKRQRIANGMRRTWLFNLENGLWRL